MTAKLQADLLNSTTGSIQVVGNSLDFSGNTGGVIIPVGTTADEGSPSFNALRINSEVGNAGTLQVYNNSNQWKDVVDTTSQFASSKISLVKDKLVLYLDSSSPQSYSGTGNDWFDLSGEDNHAVFSGLPPYQDGYFDFDGSSHRAYVTNLVYGNTSKQIPEGSFCFMARTTYDNGAGAAYNSANWSIIDWDRSEVVSVNFGGGGAINFAGRSSSSGGIGSSTIYDIAGNGIYNDNLWHYIVVTFSVEDQKIIMYADGEVDREFLADGTMTPLGSGVNRYGWIGDGSEAGTPGAGTNNVFFDGDLGIVQIYEKALSADEVLRNYNFLRTKFAN